MFPQFISTIAKKKKAYLTLKQLIINNNAEFVIGSSLGGMLAYWLSEELGLPCLLFNPAMAFQSIELEVPQITNCKCPMRIVVLGEKDDVIDPVKNKQFFAAKENPKINQKIISCSWLEHSIDFQTFEEMIFLTARNYSVWKLLNINK